MYSKSLLCLLVVVLGCQLPISSRTRPADLRPELYVEGRIGSAAISPGGDIWFGTSEGHLYVSRDRSESWQEISSPVPRGEDSLASEIGHVRFFDAQRLLLAGWLGEDMNAVYRSEDGGATWSAAQLPSDRIYVSEVQTTPDGLAWLVGSTGAVLFSEDFGRRWTELTPPFEGEAGDWSSSVHFSTRALGVVASRGPYLKVTQDGGRSWRRIESPSRTGAARCERDEIERVRLLAGRLVVVQCGALFHRPLEPDGAWQELRSNDTALLTFELVPDGLVAVSADLRVLRYSRQLEPTAEFPRLRSRPEHIAVGAGAIAIIDGWERVAFWDAQGARMGRMLGGESWRLYARDRGPDGVLWATSLLFLYRSVDGGRTWERQAELEEPAHGVAVQRSGGILVWSDSAWTRRWVPERRRFEPVPGLEDLDVVGIVRRGDLWLAFGGTQYETEGRIEVARTSFPDEFKGTVDHGWVAASTDGGDTWHVVDRWQEGGAQALFLGDDDELTLLSWLGAVRRGQLHLEPGKPPTAVLETILPATEETLSRVPYVEHASLLLFTSAEEGWVQGWTHHVDGSIRYRTQDGGRTWTRVEEALAHHPSSIHRLGGGAWVGPEDRRHLVILRAGRFEPLRDFAADMDWTVIDSTGQLLVHLESGDLWVLSGDGTSWILL